MSKPNKDKVVEKPTIQQNPDSSWPSEVEKWIVPGSLKEVLLDFTLPPPIYGYHLTIVPDREERTIKLVKRLDMSSGYLTVEAKEGQVYTIPPYRIKYWRNE